MNTMNPPLPSCPELHQSVDRMTTAIENPTSAANIERHRRAIRTNPRDAHAHARLGLALQEVDRLEDAIESQQRALLLDPNLVLLHGTIAFALKTLGKHEAALVSFRLALKFQEENAALHGAVSAVLLTLGQFEQAAASAARAIELCPDDPGFHYSLAQAQHHLTDDKIGAESFRKVLALAPDHVDAGYQLGRCLHKLKQYEEAAACFRAVLGVQPDDPDVMHALGTVLLEHGQLAEAQAVLQQTLKIAPGHRQVPVALAHTHFELGQGEQAVLHARRAVDLNPGNAALNSVMLFMLSHCCTDAAELSTEHRKFGERWDAPAWAPHSNLNDAERRLNIGFVSADLYRHAVATFVEPVFAFLGDSTQLTLHVYDNGTIEDEMTEQLRSHIACWRRITDLDDEAAEQLIRADGIDILVDLSGHSGQNRLPLFGRKPAPVQASWIGYAGTTGLKTMDYFLADQFYLPKGRYDEQFSERIVRLPIGSPFSPNPHAPPINSLPALRKGYLTFGSFHRANKISRAVVAQWSQLLRALPDSKMLLGGLKDGAPGALVDWFEEEGIDASRLLLRPRVPTVEYLRQHDEVDICLSPFPYTGSTTVAHALWMGVPTLTVVGPTNPSHAAACYIAHVGLSSFIAYDDATLVKLGVFMSQNLGALADLRAGMRDRFVNSMIGHPDIAAAALEQALRQMWRRWCAGLPPEPLQVRLSDLGAPIGQEGAA